MTLRARIALLLAVVALGVGGFSGAAAYLTTAGEVRSSVDDTLRSRAQAAVSGEDDGRDGGHDAGEGGDPGEDDAGTDCPLAGTFAPATAAQVVAADGTVTACIAGAPTLPVGEADLDRNDGAVRLRSVTADGTTYRVASIAWPEGGILQVARSTAEDARLLARLRAQLAVLVVLAAVGAAGLGWWSATRLARPIVRLRDATHRIATTLDLTTPIDVTASGEVGGLATSFAAMVGAVGRSQEQQRRLVADASHEMRTPLTSLRSNVELLREVERLPEQERQEVVDDVLEDVDELATLLGELVDLASDLATAEPEEAVVLGDLARAAAARAERRTGRPVLVRATEGAATSGRPRQLERAISNLVDNALKYSDPASEVVIEATPTTIAVLDRGRGLPPDDLTRIFDRFYRAVDVRTEPGSGLGLSIVDEIVRSHGGRVDAANREGGGARVGFALPHRPTG